MVARADQMSVCWDVRRPLAPLLPVHSPETSARPAGSFQQTTPVAGASGRGRDVSCWPVADATAASRGGRLLWGTAVVACRQAPQELRAHGAKLPQKAVKILPGPSSRDFQKATESGAVIRDNRASTPRGHASPITLTVTGIPARTVRESYHWNHLGQISCGRAGAQNPRAAQAALSLQTCDPRVCARHCEPNDVRSLSDTFNIHRTRKAGS
jgi:hypothetical protein